MVTLCHKCGGALTGNYPELYSCGCISGWVRDWQRPVALDTALNDQIEATERRLARWKEQGRTLRECRPYQRRLEKLTVALDAVCAKQFEPVPSYDI